MSKAFTREDDAATEEAFAPLPRVEAGERRYVTEEGYRALHDELDRLRAAGQERRAAGLGQLLGALTVVQPATGEALRSGRVVFGAWVTVESDSGERTTYRIVGPDEADAKAGLLSVEAPLARALLGRQEGDVVEFDRPRGRAELEITEVRHQTH